MNIIVFLLIIILLVVLNAFFIAAETSLLSSRKTSIDDQASKGNRSAKMVSLAFKKIHPYLSTPIIGSTIISIALGSIVEPILAKKIESYLHFIPNQFQIISAHSISFVIALLLLTSFHVIFGEYIPKTIAIQAPEKFILLLIGPLTFFVNFFKTSITSTPL